MPTAAEVFRDYVTEGVPGSGIHNPDKADIRAWGLGLENTVPVGTWATFDNTNELLIIRNGTNTFPVPGATSGLAVFGPDPGEGRIDIVACDSDAVLFGVRVNGTWAAPTVVTAGQQILGWSGGSIDTNGSTTIQQGGAIGGFARNTWSPTDHSWYWDFYTIASGSTSLVKAVRFSDAGGFSVGPANVFPAVGIINADNGFTVASAAATAGNFMRGDGTKFVGAAAVASDIVNVGQITVVARAVNFNSANSDTTFTFTLPTGYSNYLIQRITICKASATLTTSTVSVWTAAGGTGTQIVATGTAVTVSSTTSGSANNAQSLTATTAGQWMNNATLFFRVQTAQGSAATADVSFTIIPLS